MFECIFSLSEKPFGKHQRIFEKKSPLNHVSFRRKLHISSTERFVKLYVAHISYCYNFVMVSIEIEDIVDSHVAYKLHIHALCNPKLTR